MQDRYSGDIGDFSKLGLLRVLKDAGFSIGLNWYLTPDEKHNNDGRHIDYLKEDYPKKEMIRSCDPLLWDELKQVVDEKKRHISSLEKESILSAKYNSEKLDFHGRTKNERIAIRKEWHEKALLAMKNIDIVCADPDNGLIVPSAIERPKENKYILPDEIQDYYKQGSSVIYYQHKARRCDQFYVDQFAALLHGLDIPESSGSILKFIPVSQRYYCFILQPEHKERVTRAIDHMLKTRWGEVFCRIGDPT